MNIKKQIFTLLVLLQSLNSITIVVLCGLNPPKANR